jgi:molybdopterin synthase catalytic subunit/molybdopterin converting factor small subunit
VAELALLYFGELREAIGRDGDRIDPPSHVLTIDDLIGWLEARGEPYRAPLFERGRIRAAVDRQHVALADSFFGAQEVALFPAVGGDGAAPSAGQREQDPIMIDIRVQSADFDPGKQLARLGEINAAAVASLVVHAAGTADASAIVVEHYAAMTKLELTRIAEEARARWELAGIILIHRHGRLSPAERLLFVGAGASRRTAAVEACAYMSEQVAARAPFWRREIFAGGGNRWVRA